MFWETKSSFSVQPKYGVISFSNYLHIIFVLFLLPFTLALEAIRTFLGLTESISPAYTSKPRKRRIGDALIRSSFPALTAPEVQWVMGSGLDVYQKWTKQYKMVPTVDYLDCGEGVGTHLLWIGPKRTDKVILYCPGGAYFYPVQEQMLKFWRYAQMEWEKQGLNIGIAVLLYSVLPEGEFPTQLRQATRAIEYLHSIGCEPSNIQLVGDSAGGNLVSQVLSHILHPLPSIPPLNLPSSTRFRGAYMMSPWVSLVDSDQWGDSFHAKAYYDIAKGVENLGPIYLAHVPSSFTPYAEPVRAPDDWFAGLDDVVDRIMVSTGDEERLRDQDVVFYEKMKEHHGNAVLEVQDGGLHDDPIMDFFLSEVPLENTLTPIVLEWIAKGFKG
ncbi:hypothetical protein GYMLUDRAFT_75037 [Collybiopsis luxurians FD-317 M1]|uniref:Alpha/beta hydrolase fold-3 domain-containing protein n=1 Tax=Collybiopsis luxurians FD-317 M1 TaxID=944289 RepID=A0A0D0CIY7_9AGAR|nr:hypothetical protein GYMLUDRAFT_75037 [Collybiopsis luxurians FD-317 M1]